MTDVPDNSLIDVRSGESLNELKLSAYLAQELPGFFNKITIKQFPGGYSNLTYLITTKSGEYVLRKPPIGANIKNAHDMAREYNVLRALQEVYTLAPNPILLCEDQEVLGAPFYLMERVKGIILRNQLPQGLNISHDGFKTLSERLIDNLADIHMLDIENTSLTNIGKPAGYVERQVEGWIKRYFKAETEAISQMNYTSEWLRDTLPKEGKACFIHNDYKYDNVVLNPEDLSIKAVLDWEMSTVGDPLMDLGTSLAFWAEPNDSPLLKHFSLAWMPGNLNRQQIAERYASKTGADLSNILFYYVFGSFKIAVVAQQIYARYHHRLTKDKRFANLIQVIKACANNMERAIKLHRIDNL